MFDPTVLSAPIPGMSLTTEPGNRPWENPPQITNLEDAIEFYADKILNPEKAEAILDPLVQDISIEAVTDFVTTSFVMNGIHSLDIAFLVSPVVSEMIKYVADLNEVQYVESYSKSKKSKGMPKHEVRKIVKEAAEEYNLFAPFPEKAKEKNKLPVLEEEAPKPKGLMAKKPVEIKGE
jgi:hypothetical protein